MKTLLLILLVLIALAVAGMVGSEYYTGTPNFCGTTCHTMKKPYESWKKSRHKNIACVDCHYAPGEKRTLTAKFKGLGHLSVYLSENPEEVGRLTKVADVNCTTSKCHPITGTGKESEYWVKKVTYTEYKKEDKSKGVVPFIHKTHAEKTIEGQKAHCQACHSHFSADKHFEVSKETCFLCHFKNTKFAEDRARCSLCHEVSTRPFKKNIGPDEKPVTHQILKQRKVPCANCHFNLIQGKGEIGTEKCLRCHDDPKKLEKAKDKKLMHEKHIAEQNAQCFHCHNADIQHKKAPYFETAIQNCATCHPEPHIHQKLLIAGEGGKGIDKAYPIKHRGMNCLSCHIKDAYDVKGRKIKAAEEKTCVDCHTEREKELAGQWKKEVATLLEAAREKERELIEAIKQAKGKVSEKAIQKAESLLKAGQENLRIVDTGGGVHNKKYSALLLEIAEIDYFETAIEELKPKK